MKKKTILTGLLAALVLTCLTLGKSVLADTGLYRLYHPGLQVHLYTTDTNEYKVLGARGWKQEGLAWNTADKQGDAVYRLYHPGLRVHLYTKDTNEYKVLATRGGNRRVLLIVLTEPCLSTASTIQASRSTSTPRTPTSTRS